MCHKINTERDSESSTRQNFFWNFFWTDFIYIWAQKSPKIAQKTDHSIAICSESLRLKTAKMRSHLAKNAVELIKSIYLGSQRRVMGQKPNKNFFTRNPSSKYQIILKSLWDSGTHQVQVLTLTFCFKMFPDIYVYIGSPIMGQNPMNFFALAPCFKVTPQSGQNEIFGSTLKNFHGVFVPHLFPSYIFKKSQTNYGPKTE